MIEVRNDLIKEGVAFDYQEPMSLVMSRSGDECVVALVDQWYMDYGSAEWKPKAEAYVLFLSLLAVSSDSFINQPPCTDEHIQQRDAECLRRRP